MCKHAAKGNGLHDLMEIMLESMMVAERGEFLADNPGNKGNGYRLLDRVQRNKPINKEARTKLRELNLIEGRHPHIIISRKIAQLTNMEAEYTDLKGFDDNYYKDLILKSISDHEKLRRNIIDKLLCDKLPKTLNNSQKKNHIDYLLKSLRKAGKIHVGPNKFWELGAGNNSAKIP